MVRLIGRAASKFRREEAGYEMYCLGGAVHVCSVDVAYRIASAAKLLYYIPMIGCAVGI